MAVDSDVLAQFNKQMEGLLTAIKRAIKKNDRVKAEVHLVLIQSAFNYWSSRARDPGLFITEGSFQKGYVNRPIMTQAFKEQALERLPVANAALQEAKALLKAKGWL